MNIGCQYMNVYEMQDTNTELYLSSYVNNKRCDITHIFRYISH
jgi:hypothetical protein